MLEQAEFNLFVRASFNPKNVSCTKNEVMVRQSYINNADDLVLIREAFEDLKGR